MVIVKLMGALGNQLFQYAIGLRIALDNDLIFKLDVTDVENDFYKRTYSLRHFNITENIASKTDLKYLQRSRRRLFRMANRLIPFNKSYEVKEKSPCFDHDVLRPYKKVYLNGFWQSEKYFKSIEDILRKELTVKKPLIDQNLKTANDIIKTNSVGIHFRRLHGVSTDGNTNIKEATMYGKLPIEYYNLALRYLSNKYNNLTLFIFADDPEWVKENAEFRFPTNFVTHNTYDKDYEDLRLMSLCKHQIIANSSFSWWSAWLNANPGKIVITPKKQYNDRALYNRDYIPESWIKIEFESPY